MTTFRPDDQPLPTAPATALERAARRLLEDCSDPRRACDGCGRRARCVGLWDREVTSAWKGARSPTRDEEVIEMVKRLTGGTA